MKVAAIQHDIVWEDKQANLAQVRERIAEAAGAGARLIALTELFATGFTMNSTEHAEGHDGPTTKFLRDTARDLGVWVGGSIIQRHPSVRLPYNQFILAGPDGQVHRYAKLHPFSYAGEHQHYSAGQQTVTVDVEGLRVSLFVCYDLRFANVFWAAALDTDCYLIVANWPAPRREHWRCLLNARAIENQAFVVGVNRVGSGGGNDYAGDSLMVDPMGRILADGVAEPGQPATGQILYAEVDPATVARTRAEFPFLADRRG